MPTTLDQLTGASHGPAGEPVMLTIGDSLMWGQGLRPEHRFRELVRKRLGDEVVELSMARSGAKLHPDADSLDSPGIDVDDQAFRNQFLSNVPANYLADQYIREVPSRLPTALRQLEAAAALLKGDEHKVRYILLDGGINDVTIGGILLPVLAYREDYFLSSWNAWILHMARDVVEPQMIVTLDAALQAFPNATIVVNGYFPVFSYFSAAAVSTMHSVGLIHSAVVDIPVVGVLLELAGLDALASASSTWFAASNRHLRNAIKTVSNAHPDRVVLFARSGIEQEHCLFAPDSWLWGMDVLPNRFPANWPEALQFLAGATATDEVVLERAGACAAVDPADTIMCPLASVGHPNVWGARNYAESIIDELEIAGVLDSARSGCDLGHRRRQRTCTNVTDSGEYACVNIHAKISDSCKTATKALGETAGGLFKSAGDSLNRAGASLTSVPRCFDSVDRRMRKCSNAQAQEQAACNAAFVSTRDGPCNIVCTAFTNCDDIQCTSFTNCGDLFFLLQPACWAARGACELAALVEKGLCWAARGVCVAAAAVARAACIAVAAVVLAACIAVAIAKGVVCKAAAVVEAVACAVVQVVVAAVHTIVAGAKVVAGVGVAIAAGLTQAVCTAGGWLINRLCRLGTWVVGALCKLGAGAVSLACHVAAAVVGMVIKVGGVLRAGPA